MHFLRSELRVLHGCADGESERLAHPANGEPDGESERLAHITNDEPDGSTDGTDGDAKRQSEYVA